MPQALMAIQVVHRVIEEPAFMDEAGENEPFEHLRGKRSRYVALEKPGPPRSPEHEVAECHPTVRELDDRLHAAIGGLPCTVDFPGLLQHPSGPVDHVVQKRLRAAELGEHVEVRHERRHADEIPPFAPADGFPRHLLEVRAKGFSGSNRSGGQVSGSSLRASYQILSSAYPGIAPSEGARLTVPMSGQATGRRSAGHSRPAM